MRQFKKTLDPCMVPKKDCDPDYLQSEIKVSFWYYLTGFRSMSYFD